MDSKIDRKNSCYWIAPLAADTHSLTSVIQLQVRPVGTIVYRVQGWVLQLCDSDPVPEHGVPPQASLMRMECERCWVPVPHVLEHDDQGVQLFHWQFWRQHWVLHVCVSLSLPPHGVPPFRAGTSIVLLRSWVPPPQATEHVAQPLHWDHTQSTVNILWT